MQTVILKGELGNRFGEKWNVNCDNLLDIFKLIGCQREGLTTYLIECQENEIDFSIQRGNTYIEDESELLMSVGDKDITITPIPRGSKGDIGKLIVAALLIYAAFQVGMPPDATMSGGTTKAGVDMTTVRAHQISLTKFQKFGKYMLLMMGTSLGLRTINEMLMPTPDQDDDDDSHLFGGPTNNTTEGTPVPIAYGELMVGGVVINGSYTATRGKSYGSGYSNTHNTDGSTKGGGDKSDLSSIIV